MEGEGRCTKRRVDVEEVLAVDVVVGKMAKMHFIEGHLRRVLDQVVASEEGQSGRLGARFDGYRVSKS